jgi:hypothetical protein
MAEKAKKARAEELFKFTRIKAELVRSAADIATVDWTGFAKTYGQWSH